MSAHPAAGKSGGSSGSSRHAGNTVVNFAVALHQSDWEPEFFSYLSSELEGQGSFKRCVDIADVVADVLAGLAGTVILDADFAGLDASTVSRIASHAGIVGLCVDLVGESRLRQWGVDSVVLLAPGELQQSARSAMGLALELHKRRGVVLDGQTGLDSMPQDASALTLDGAGDGLSEEISSPGRKVVVFGVKAGSGATTVATGIAEALAAEHGSTTLIDLDLDSPSISDNLALTEDVGGLLRACRLAERGNLTAAGMAQTARALDDSFRVLVGLSAPHRKPEVRPVALTRVLDQILRLDRNLVIDLGSPWVAVSPSLESGELKYSLLAQDEVRTDVIEQLGVGDSLVAVIDCSPIAIAQSSILIGQIAKLAPEATMTVVINRVRKSMLKPRELAEVCERLTQMVERSVAVSVRYDLDTADKALLAGLTFKEVAPRSVAAADLNAVAEQLVRQVEFV